MSSALEGDYGPIAPLVGISSVTGLGTGVATALAINVGTAGAPVVLNGALGTPSSGTLGACIGGSLVSYLASTVTYNNTAALADTALSVTVLASGIYDINLVVHSTAGFGAGSSLNMDFGGTATVTNFIGQWHVFTQDDPGVKSGLRVTAASTDFSGGGSFEDLSSFYTFNGSIEVNGAGTFLLRGAQTGAVAVNTTIIRGSTLSLLRMA